MRIEIVSDVSCPWCYIGKRRLERAMAMRPDLAIERTWRPFQLNPDLPPDGMSRELFLTLKLGSPRNTARLLANLAAVGRSEGIEFAFGEIRRMPNTLLAHRLIRLAGDEGCEPAIVEALFRSYFTDGRDIGDIATLGDIAGECGMGARSARSHLQDQNGAAATRAEDLQARRLGIHAVPCFILDGYAISGAHEPQTFLPLFDLAAEARKWQAIEV